MKITILAIAALALATAPFGRAQDVESSPTAAEKSDSTTSEVTATAAPEESAAPASERSAAPAAEKSAAPAAAKSASTETKKATAATAAKSTSAKPAAPAAAAAPMKKMNVDEAVKDMENRWEASFLSHDPTAVQAMVANDFVGVYWDGKVLNRSGVLSSFKKDKDTYKTARNESLKVHTFGPNIAVVVGTAHEKGAGKDGKAFDRTFRFTDTWVERNGQWQCVASQVMKLKG